jgi:hypothetical protein
LYSCPHLATAAIYRRLIPIILAMYMSLSCLFIWLSLSHSLRYLSHHPSVFVCKCVSVFVCVCVCERERERERERHVCGWRCKLSHAKLTIVHLGQNEINGNQRSISLDPFTNHPPWPSQLARFLNLSIFHYFVLSLLIISILFFSICFFFLNQ